MKHLKPLLCLLLCLSFLVAGVACGRNLPVVMSRGTIQLEEDVYRYWLCCYRAQFAYEETEENRARLAELSDLNIRKTVVAASLFDEFGLSLDENARTVIEAGLERMVENAGGREEFDKQAATYGISYDGLKQALIYEQKASAVYTYLFGKNGVITVTDEQYEDYYQKTYAHVRMIYIPYVDFVLSEDGDRQWDEAAGGYLYTQKTGAALAEAEEKTAALRAALAGEIDEAGFTALGETYDSDPAGKTYTSGYYFSEEEDYSTYIPAVTEAALALEVGEVAEVKSEYGVHFILGLALDAEAYIRTENKDFFAEFPSRTARYLYHEVIESYLGQVVVYHEVKDAIRYEDMTPNFDLYW